MPNPFGAPELTVHDVKRKLDGEEYFVWLDVREPYELKRAAIHDYRVATAPVSRLAQFQAEGLPEEAQNQQADIVVFCHHGVRSAQVTMWLRQQGWTNVYNMGGGIAAWALEIDPSVGHY
jgi:rhodanese-related sulfurtransferase